MGKNYCPECDQCLGTKYWCQPCQSKQFRENFDNWTTESKEIDNFIKETQLEATDCTEYLEWFPFSSFIGISKYDVSEVGTVYTANIKKGPRDAWDETEQKYERRRDLLKVALISLGNAPAVFLKELKLHYKSRTHNGLMIRLFGVTRETITGHLMMVAETCEWDLRHYVSHHYTRLTWSRKVAILHSIASALESFRRGEQVHRDYIPNGKIFKSHLEIPVNELGLGECKDPIPIIGYYKNDLMPLMAPEVLLDNTCTTKSDIYSFGMLMWEFSTNKPPFYDKPHNSKLIDSICYFGLRPVNDPSTPECYKELMKRCWVTNPNERPDISEIVKVLEDWNIYKKNSDQFETAEEIRIKRVKDKGLDPTPGKMVSPPKVHPQAIYTSRKLKFPIFPLSSANIQKIRQSFETAERNNTIDLASLLVRDESYFGMNKFVQPRQLEDDADEDLKNQYELSIPFDTLPFDIMVH